MLDRRRSPARRILVVTAIILAVLVVTGLVLVTRRTPPPEPAAARPDVPAAAQPVSPLLPPARPGPLTQGELIAAAADAASAYGLGRPSPKSTAELVGRRFEVRIPFGCGGGAQASTIEPAGTEVDPKRGTVKLSAKPQVWTDQGWAKEIVGPGEYEAIEGFWIPRPWLNAEQCPSAPSDGVDHVDGSDSRQSLGLVTLFEPGASRTLQRGARPYEFVLKAPEGNVSPAPGEFRLVIGGRVTGFADGRAIRCWSASIDQRPTCLVGVEIDHVAFLNPVTGETVADWASG